MGKKIGPGLQCLSNKYKTKILSYNRNNIEWIQKKYKWKKTFNFCILIKRGKNTGKNKVLCGVVVWIQIQLDSCTRTRCHNGSKKAKYEKIFYGLRSRMFSQEVGASLGDGKVSWMRLWSTYIKNSLKINFSKIFLRFFHKNYGPGSESGFSKAWIRLHNNGFWRKNWSL